MSRPCRWRTAASLDASASWLHRNCGQSGRGVRPPSPRAGRVFFPKNSPHGTICVAAWSAEKIATYLRIFVAAGVRAARRQTMRSRFPPSATTSLIFAPHSRLEPRKLRLIVETPCEAKRHRIRGHPRQSGGLWGNGIGTASEGRLGLRERVAYEKRRAEGRLDNGADCPRTAATGLAESHCCKNGHCYRFTALKPTSTFEPAFEVPRVDQLDATRGGWWGAIGRGPRRGGRSRRWHNRKMTFDAVQSLGCVTLTLVPRHYPPIGWG